MIRFLWETSCTNNPARTDMLTPAERQTLRAKCDLLSLHGLEALAVHCAKEGRPDGAKYVRDIIAQRQMSHRANAVPFEVAGQRRSMESEKQIEYPPYWTPERIRYAVYAVGVSGGIVAALVYVVIPALIVAASAVVAFVSAVAPYVAGGILAFIVLRESLFGQKKTDNYPAENPARSGGNTYNVYVGEGQVHVHQNNGQR